MASAGSGDGVVGPGEVLELTGALHHQRAERQSGDDSVADREVHVSGPGSEGELADERAPGRHDLTDAAATTGIVDVETAAEHRHPAPLDRHGVRHVNRVAEGIEKRGDLDGQILEAHSISAGLDYPGIGPEHSWLHDTGRVEYVSATDAEALEAFQLCSRMEGIIPALEPAHALAHVSRIAPELPRDHVIVMNMCGRGDKDVFTVADALGVKL